MLIYKLWSFHSALINVVPLCLLRPEIPHTLNVTLHTDITHLFLCPHLPWSFSLSLLPSLTTESLCFVFVFHFILSMPVFLLVCLPSCKQFLQ